MEHKMRNITLKFVTGAVGQFLDKMSATAKLARKFDLPEPEITLFGTYLKKVKPEFTWQSDVQVWHQAEVSVPESYSYGNYEVVACKNLRDDDISVFTKEEQIPVDFINAEDYCDHCKTRRQRKNVFLVKDRDNDIYIQLGGDCTRHYTGYTPEQLLGIFETISKIGSTLGSFFDSDPWVKPTYSTHLLVKVMSIMMNDMHMGYKDAKNEIYAYVKNIKMFNGDPAYAQSTDDLFENIDSYSDEIADKVIDWLKELEYDENGVLNDYYYALWQAANKGYTSKLGLPGSGVYIYNTNNAAGEDALNEFYGDAGERIDLDLILKRLKHFETAYGISTLFTFADSKGRTFIWWGSGKTADRIIDEFDNNVRKFRLKATIKEHKTYQQTKQTVITRTAMRSALIS